jgi:hypothetical protein
MPGRSSFATHFFLGRIPWGKGQTPPAPPATNQPAQQHNWTEMKNAVNPVVPQQPPTVGVRKVQNRRLSTSCLGIGICLLAIYTV